MSEELEDKPALVVAPHDKRPLYLQVAEALRHAITSGEFAPGQQLPSRLEMATLYKVAPMTVQHALRELRDEGLIVSIQGHGVFVSEQGARHRHAVDWEWVAEALALACVVRGMTMREVAGEIGIPASGLTRLRQGKHLSADALAALMAWLFPTQIPLWIKES